MNCDRSLDVIGLRGNAAAVLPDSGGLDEERNARGARCLAIRGWAEILGGGCKRGGIPGFGVGHAAERIAADLSRWLLERHAPALA